MDAVLCDQRSKRTFSCSLDSFYFFYSHYTMEEVNIEWPERLAKLVAEKNDGTRLIHVTHLNCHQPQAREYSNILRQDASYIISICIFLLTHYTVYHVDSFG